MIDIHSHILPGVDDGAKDLDESLAMARMAVADGVKTIVATPHAWHPQYNVSVEERDSALAALREGLLKHKIPLTLLPGAECTMRDGLVEVVVDRLDYALGNRRSCILLEWPDEISLNMMKPLLFDARIKGMDLLMAHAERHPDVLARPESLAELVESGLRVQVSSSSLTRSFGWRMKRLVKKLLRDGLVYVIASDGHNAARRPPLLADAVDVAQKIMGPQAIDLVTRNPEKLIFM